MLGQVVTYQAPIVGTPEGGQYSTLTSQSLGPSQTVSYLQAQQQLVGSRVYSRRLLPQVGQPYQLQMTDDQVLQQVYKDMPSEMEQVPEEGTNPQLVVKLKSGLEVPEYIIKRDAARKEAENIRLAEIASRKPPTFYKVGKYAEKNPAIASIAALVIGAVLANVYYDLTTQ